MSIAEVLYNTTTTTKKIIFNSSNLFKLNDNYKHFQRKLKLFAIVVVNKEKITNLVLENCLLLILTISEIQFEESEINALHTFINNGGRILVLLTESSLNDTGNINIFLEKYGIIPNMDSLIRTHYYKYFHPKECIITDSKVNFCLSRNIANWNVLYPFGCTMNVNKPSVVAFTSGSSSFPVDQPLGALYYDILTGGKIVAIGSGYMFDDKYIDQESNDQFIEALFDFLNSNEKMKLKLIEQDDNDVLDNPIVSDSEQLAAKPKLCLSDAMNGNFSVDYTQFFNHKMHSMTTNYVLATINLYNEVNLKHKPLKIISPKFEAPFPSLLAAVFPPSFQELRPPPLELFDLDEEFSSIFSKLAQFTNKYIQNSDDVEEIAEENLNLYINECSKILRVSNAADSIKEMLYKIGSILSQFKSIDTIK